jgi:hypothetical protein
MSIAAPWTHQERRGSPCKLAIISATGFLAIFGCPRPPCRDREETARFSGEPLLAKADRPLARFVSIIVRRDPRSRVRLTDLALSLK